MCGGEGKECAICRFGDDNCLTAMYEDNFCLATKNQIIERLNNNRYPCYRQVMINALNTKFNHVYVNGETIIEEYPSQNYCCENNIHN